MTYIYFWWLMPQCQPCLKNHWFTFIPVAVIIFIVWWFVDLCHYVGRTWERYGRHQMLWSISILTKSYTPCLHCHDHMAAILFVYWPPAWFSISRLSKMILPVDHRGVLKIRMCFPSARNHTIFWFAQIAVISGFTHNAIGKVLNSATPLCRHSWKFHSTHQNHVFASIMAKKNINW